MFKIFLFSFLLFTFFSIFGNIINKQSKSNNINLYICETILFGAILISVISLFVNFFIPLNKLNNTIIYILLIFLSFFYVQKEFFLKIIKLGVIVSFFVTIFFIFTNLYRPDAGLYHLPYVGILNNEKIIFGLTNIHFRFGHTSILQYISAFHNNYLYNLDGIELSKAVLIISAIFYFIFVIIENKKKTKNEILNLYFCYFVIAYIAYKFNRYSEYGNDGFAHLCFFYFLSVLIKNLYSIDFNKLSKLILISIFLFLNKITFLLSAIFLIPYLNKFKKYKKNIFFFLSIILVAMSFSKSLISSGCLIYPIKFTCLNQLPWYNDNLTSKIILESEVWTKDWKNRKNKEISMEEFNANFNWLNSYKNFHLIKISSVLIPYISSLIFLFLIISIKNKERIFCIKKFDKKENYILYSLLLCNILWFIKFPLYRYGTSFIISLLFFITLKFINFKILKKILNYKNAFIIILFLSFSVKQTHRIFFKDIKNSISPNLISEGKYNLKKDKKIIINNKLAYYESGNRMCFYKLYICTNYKNINNLEYTLNKDYKFFNIKKIN